MKFLAVGFLFFALFLSVTVAMTLNAQNVPIAGFKPKDDGPSCHGRGHGGGHGRGRPDSSSSANATDATVDVTTNAA